MIQLIGMIFDIIEDELFSQSVYNFLKTDPNARKIVKETSDDLASNDKTKMIKDIKKLDSYIKKIYKKDLWNERKEIEY